MATTTQTLEQIADMFDFIQRKVNRLERENNLHKKELEEYVHELASTEDRMVMLAESLDRARDETITLRSDLNSSQIKVTGLIESLEYSQNTNAELNRMILIHREENRKLAARLNEQCEITDKLQSQVQSYEKSAIPMHANNAEQTKCIERLSEKINRAGYLSVQVQDLYRATMSISTLIARRDPRNETYHRDYIIAFGEEYFPQIQWNAEYISKNLENIEIMVHVLLQNKLNQLVSPSQ